MPGHAGRERLRCGDEALGWEGKASALLQPEGSATWGQGLVAGPAQVAPSSLLVRWAMLVEARGCPC